MSAKFVIDKQDARLTQSTRQILIEQIAALEDGVWQIEITPGRRGYTSTRYRYYFDAVLWAILEQAGQHYMQTDASTGETHRMRNTADLHLLMKMLYNPVTVQVGRLAMTMPGSTTEMTDREFIGAYMEQIIADHSGPPYLVDFVGYDEWKALHKAGEWSEFKAQTQK